VCECSGGKPLREMKVKVRLTAAEVGTREGAPSTGLWPTGLGLRLSTPVGTRKMVNYA
jgi:hypothetical protein